MADRKISELTNITGANLADGDELVVVDTSESETKAITFGEFKTALDTSTGFVRITGDTMTGNLDVQGTVTADGLTVDGVAAVNANNINYSGSSPKINIYENDTTNVNTQLIQTSGDFFIRTLSDDAASTSNRIKVDHATGDISFYEDTGTTAKFFWDASAESLGIGTSSPDTKLHLEQTSQGNFTEAMRISNGGGGANEGNYIQFEVSNASGYGSRIGGRREGTGGIGLHFYTGPINSSPTERMRIDSSGRVGIGGVPNTNWRNDQANQEVLMLGTEATFFSDSGVTTELWNNAYVDNSDTFKNISTRGASRYFQYQGAHKWYTAASATAGSTISTELNTTPKMILDVSGNLLVGKTSTDFDVAGIFMGNDVIHGIRDDAHPLALNRKTSDGDLIQFYKDGSTVGSIGSYAGSYLQIGSNNDGIAFGIANSIRPVDMAGSQRDAAIDLGDDTARFKDLYLSGGVYLGGTGPANKLDDYEEGTFTPVLADAQTGGNTASVATATGLYTKVGRQVTCKVEFVNINTSGLTGANTLWLRGLPFTVDRGLPAVTRLDDWNFDDTGWVVVELVESGTTGRFFNIKDNTSDAIMAVNQINSGNADCSIHLTYFV